ncbi:helix-turn-helix transcriptional regulator [Saliphagus infecundisoli]|uniref:Helix-turn-helix transcriptional regulator n=1 Tax=Saliphagus infecundisoli TaxID=1849069 RepID=A0ABD5QCD6_9EURY|nr:MarR family transcriptional regulator [Saliphagus infecundisoli]
MESTLDDIRFLVDSENRVDALTALREGPCDRDELQATTGASAPTVGRILGDFEERGWVRRDGHEYELTKPGAYVAEHFMTFFDRMHTERRLRDIWQWLPSEMNGFTLEMVAEGVVTVVEPGDPYGPANRCASLYRETDQLRGFDAALTAPHHFEELYHQVIDGMDTKIIFPPTVSENIASTYPQKASEVLESDSFTLWLHDDIPLYRVLIFDDCIGIGGYDADSGVLQVYVDTDAPEACAWAESTFESYRREARCITS